MTVRGAFHLDAPEGDRWELALDLLRVGGQAVEIGGIVLRRDTAGPLADGLIHADVIASYDPKSLTEQQAHEDVRRGRSVMMNLLEADGRLSDLASEHGLACDYVHDYGMGSVLLATVAGDGSITWQAPFRPHT
jgi:hypothetical protein